MMVEYGFGSYEDCLEALKKHKGDKDAACNYLLNQKL
jgi:hypothetical protein